MKNLDDAVRKVVNLFSHPVWFIVRDLSYECPCRKEVSKQADKSCPICFGTGYRITLNRVNAAHQNNRISMRGDGMGFSEIDIVNVYYTNTDTGIKVGDIINDGEDFDVVKDVYYEHSDQQSVVYYRIETVPYKYDVHLLKKLMIKTLEKAGYNG